MRVLLPQPASRDYESLVWTGVRLCLASQQSYELWQWHPNAPREFAEGLLLADVDDKALVFVDKHAQWDLCWE